MFLSVLNKIRLCLVSISLQTFSPSNFLPLCTPSDVIAHSYTQAHTHRDPHAGQESTVRIFWKKLSDFPETKGGKRGIAAGLIWL